MGLMDLIKAKENKQLKSELDNLKSLFTSEQFEAKAILDSIKELEGQKTTLQESILNLKKEVLKLNEEIDKKKQEIVVLDEEILLQDFGLYEPKYDFATSDEYKNKLNEIRNKQKDMVKNKTSVTYSENWQVDGSKAKGKKMTNDNIKQILRSFNTECENAIDRVKFNNIDSMKKRIEKSFESLNKLNQTVQVELRVEYLQLKIEELYLAYEYQVKKQEEKEEQKRIREEMREEVKLQKELEEAKKNITKDIKHFTNALNTILIQLEDVTLNEEKRRLLLEKKAELDNQIGELEKNLADVDYRQANQRAGYVYVISNIGAFGENIYKIGMTRRLEPLDRVNELGDASVPFNFDVHAMIFSDDAPSLENALHKAFENKKVNMINQRREFFDVTLDEIENVINANYDKTVEFNRVASAEQYRESLKIKEAIMSR